MRAAVLTTSAVLALSVGALPARAAGAVTCTLQYDRTVGVSEGRATCDGGRLLLSFTASNGCPLQTASGAGMTGSTTFSFEWTRTGATGVMTTYGPGTAALAFSSPCPAQGETMVITSS